MLLLILLLLLALPLSPFLLLLLVLGLELDLLLLESMLFPDVAVTEDVGLVLGRRGLRVGDLISVGLNIVGGNTGFSVGGVTTALSSLIDGDDVGLSEIGLLEGAGGGETSGSIVGESVALLNVGKGVAGTGIVGASVAGGTIGSVGFNVVGMIGRDCFVL